jgi:hypothetical protein
VENVEEQRLQDFRILAHALEVETLETRKGHGVVFVVEDKTERTATYPFGETR